MLTLAAHEGIPGHHFASVAQQSLTNMPEEAKVRLEDKFHIARFHQEVLGGGNLPLRVLSEQVREM